MNSLRIVAPVAIPFALLLGNSAALAAQDAPEYSGTPQQIIDQIVDDVVGRRVREVQDEVRRRTQIDPIDQGYDPDREYRRPSGSVTSESRQELQQLDAEHDRTVRRLEEELERKIEKARDEFEREAASEDKPEKIADKRRKLEEKVDRAYDKFNRKMAKEVSRFDEKRDKILSKNGGSSGHGGDHKKGKGDDKKREKGV